MTACCSRPGDRPRCPPQTPRLRSKPPLAMLVCPDPSEIDTQSDTLRSGRARDSWTPSEAESPRIAQQNETLDATGRGRIGGNRPLNQGVAGSIPARPTNRIIDLRRFANSEIWRVSALWRQGAAGRPDRGAADQPARRTAGGRQPCVAPNALVDAAGGRRCRSARGPGTGHDAGPTPHGAGRGQKRPVIYVDASVALAQLPADDRRTPHVTVARARGVAGTASYARRAARRDERAPTPAGQTGEIATYDRRRRDAPHTMGIPLFDLPA